MYFIQIKAPKQVLVDLKRKRLSHISSTKGLGWLGMVCIWIIQESGECVAWIITSSHSTHQLDVLLPYSLPSPTNQNSQHVIQPNHLGKSVFFSGMILKPKFEKKQFQEILRFLRPTLEIHLATALNHDPWVQGVTNRSRWQRSKTCCSLHR